MRWFVVKSFIIILICSLIIIAVTRNPFLVSLPTYLLFFMRPIVRYLFPANNSAQQQETDKEQLPRWVVAIKRLREELGPTWSRPSR